MRLEPPSMCETVGRVSRPVKKTRTGLETRPTTLTTGILTDNRKTFVDRQTLR
jgi:hypothetical protein